MGAGAAGVQGRSQGDRVGGIDGFGLEVVLRRGNPTLQLLGRRDRNLKHKPRSFERSEKPHRQSPHGPSVVHFMFPILKNQEPGNFHSGVDRLYLHALPAANDQRLRRRKLSLAAARLADSRARLDLPEMVTRLTPILPAISVTVIPMWSLALRNCSGVIALVFDIGLRGRFRYRHRVHFRDCGVA